MQSKVRLAATLSTPGLVRIPSALRMAVAALARRCIGVARNRVEGYPAARTSPPALPSPRTYPWILMRRFTRLTNAFSMNAGNRVHATSIYLMHYNFVRIHQAMQVFPR
jgi:hypothetical protein